jgi:hypothetical protein
MSERQLWFWLFMLELSLRQVIQLCAHVRGLHFEKQLKSVIALPNEAILLAGGRIIGYGNNITCT